MQNTFPTSREILLKILTIIDYKDNKENFAKKFITAQLQQTFSDLINALSKEQKAELENKLSANPTNEEIYKLLQGYLTPQKYTELFLESLKDFFMDYIQTIMPLLTNEKKEELHTYLSSLFKQFQITAQNN